MKETSASTGAVGEIECEWTQPALDERLGSLHGSFVVHLDCSLCERLARCAWQCIIWSDAQFAHFGALNLLTPVDSPSRRRNIGAIDHRLERRSTQFARAVARDIQHPLYDERPLLGVLTRQATKGRGTLNHCPIPV